VDIDLEGRVAVVTGAAQGIGRGYALTLAEHGAAVVVADLNATGAQATADVIEQHGGSALPVTVDVSDRASTLELAEATRQRFGAAHIVVNNAALYHSMRLDPQLTVDIEYWRLVFSVNVDGPLLVTQALAPLLIEAGWGRVVMQTSTAAYGNGGAYGTSKLALISLTRGFARELGGHGITVNAIAPGPILTENLASVGEDAVRMSAMAMPMRRVGDVDEVAAAAVWLCSDQASFVTGVTLPIDGGKLAGTPPFQRKP
jgi:NAD(P)-dependent dehydrogenase (short-subunit alcohol dehydrogenase family)